MLQRGSIGSPHGYTARGPHIKTFKSYSIPIAIAVEEIGIDNEMARDGYKLITSQPKNIVTLSIVM